MKKEETHFTVIILVQEKVAISLHRLGSGDGLQNINLYEVYESTLSKIIKTIGLDCMLWDYEFGWVNFFHNRVVFQITRIEPKSIEGKFQPYELIGDATYPVMPWM